MLLLLLLLLLVRPRVLCTSTGLPGGKCDSTCLLPWQQPDNMGRRTSLV